jgi:predicted phage terminase large subunit-like protein
LAARLGRFPQIIVTTTPRNTPLFRELVQDPKVVVVRESTFANLDNLAPSFRDSILSRYSGTTLGRQEIEAELLLDIEGALWKIDELDAHRVESAPPDLRRVVVGVDPAGSSKPGSDETGIIVVAQGADRDGYVLADRSGRFSPDEWARRAINCYHEFRADAIIAEKNYGGEMVASTLATVDPKVPVRMVSATRGKVLRAQPIAAMYEQGRVHHCGRLSDLESQLVTWTEDSRDSPDRLDALVWGLSEVMENWAASAATVATFDPRARPVDGAAVRSFWQRPRSGSVNEPYWDSSWAGRPLFEPPGEAEPPVRRYPKGTFDDIF